MLGNRVHHFRLVSVCIGYNFDTCYSGSPTRQASRLFDEYTINIGNEALVC